MGIAVGAGVGVAVGIGVAVGAGVGVAVGVGVGVLQSITMTGADPMHHPIDGKLSQASPEIIRVSSSSATPSAMVATRSVVRCVPAPMVAVSGPDKSGAPSPLP